MKRRLDHKIIRWLPMLVYQAIAIIGLVKCVLRVEAGKLWGWEGAIAWGFFFVAMAAIALDELRKVHRQ